MSEMEWRARAKRKAAEQAGQPVPAATGAQPLKRNQAMHFGAIQTATHYDSPTQAGRMGEDGQRRSLAEQLGLKTPKAKVLKAPEAPPVETTAEPVADTGDGFKSAVATFENAINSDVVEPVQLVTPDAPAQPDKDDLL